MGKRRDALAAINEQMFAEYFAGRSLPFVDACATEYAVLVAARNRLGHLVSTEDA